MKRNNSIGVAIFMIVGNVFAADFRLSGEIRLDNIPDDVDSIEIGCNIEATGRLAVRPPILRGNKRFFPNNRNRYRQRWSLTFTPLDRSAVFIYNTWSCSVSFQGNNRPVYTHLANFNHFQRGNL